MALILASASPRRQALLDQIGCQFKVVVSHYLENNGAGLGPADLVIRQAIGKASEVAKDYPADVIVAADTIVALDGLIFGKPEHRQQAKEMLTHLSGREHEVYTGIAVMKGAELFFDYARTIVRIRQLSPEQINKYAASGEPDDKAGAYAIQGLGSLLVANINGCYYNVVGLPLVTLDKLLAKVGIQLL